MTKFRILLVDDDEVFRDAVEKTLASQGYEALTAPNGKIAMDLLRSQKIDLVISDIRMPEMDGIELLKWIRGHSSTPVILITGFSEIIETKAAYEMGANEFLAKPFQRQDLVRAIRNCLVSGAQAENEHETQYCKLGINDFLTGRTIKFNIFVQLAGGKYVKIGHKGEDISPERIRFYREKGLLYFYLRREDFRQYVGFSLALAKAASQKKNAIHIEKKLSLLRHTGEVLNDQIRHHGIDAEIYDSASAFVEATMDILTDDVNAVHVLEALKNHGDYLLVHSVGVSLYSLLIANALDWSLPTNKFKLAMGGLLHDVGMKEVNTQILTSPRYSWNYNDVKTFEDHPLRGIHVLHELENISDDVREVVKQHHENCLSRGYPFQLKRTAIHPMAKLISVADEFCYRTIQNPQNPSLGPIDALQDMMINCADQLDKKFFDALVRVFKGPST